MLSSQNEACECCEERPASIVLDRGRAAGPDIRKIRLSFGSQEASERIFVKRGAPGSSAGSAPRGETCPMGIPGTGVFREKKKGGIRGKTRTRGGGSFRETPRGESKTRCSTSNWTRPDGDEHIARLLFAREAGDDPGHQAMHVTESCVERSELVDGTRSVRLVARPSVFSRSRKAHRLGKVHDDRTCCGVAHSHAL